MYLDTKFHTEKELIQFLLDFSKSYKVIKTKSNRQVEVNLN